MDEPTSEFWQWVRSNKRGKLEAGYDVGRTKHVSALVITDTLNGIRDVRAVVILANKEFGVQEKVINECIRITQPVAFRFDHKGLGMDLGERLAKRHGSMFYRIDFTNENKVQMVTNLKYQLEQRTIRIPSWSELVDNIHSIKKEVNERTTNVMFESDSTVHHGDAAWALMLAGFDPQGMTGTPSAGFRGSRIITKENLPV
jgi:phage FluMu gp28-like protein